MAVTRLMTVGELLAAQRTGAAWAFDAAGRLTEVAANMLRQDWDPATLTFRGVLAESQAVNLVTNPRWEGAATGAPGTAPTGMSFNGVGGWSHEIVALGAEDGMPTLDLRVWSPASNGNVNNYRFNLVPTITLAAGQAATGAICHRLVAGSMAGFTSRLIIGNVSPIAGANLPDPTGAPLRSQRLALTRTPGAEEAGTYVAYALLTPGPSGSGAGDVTIRLGLPQLVLANILPSPSLPPVGTPGTSTRNADLLVMSAIERWFSAAQGTFVLDFTPGQATAAAARGILAADDGTFSNCFDVSMPSGSLAVQMFSAIGGGTNVALTTIGTASLLARNTLRLSYGPAGFIGSLNGAPPVVVAGATVPNLTRVKLGDRRGNFSAFLNGWVGPRMSYYPVQYTDAPAADGFTIRTR